jgi:co-chaperonin GroES (HSP10)
MKLLGKRILIKVVRTLPKVGSIVIPEQYRKNTQEAVVVEVGDEVEAGIKKGDRILWDVYNAREIFIDKERFLIIKENEVQGVIA